MYTNVGACTNKRLQKTILPYVYFDSNNSKFTLCEGDCRRVLAQLPEESVDLIFADPPYFLSNGGSLANQEKLVSVHKGEWMSPGAQRTTMRLT